MFVVQPEIPVPLAVNFPFPAWATRPSEAGAAPTSLAVKDPVRRAARPEDDIPLASPVS